jgi:hypothetical protein
MFSPIVLAEENDWRTLAQPHSPLLCGYGAGSRRTSGDEFGRVGVLQRGVLREVECYSPNIG